MATASQTSAAPILRLTLLFTGAVFALAGAEELIRTDPASSKTASFIFVLLAVALFGFARYARVTVSIERFLLETVQRVNPVLARAIKTRSGQCALALFIAGVISSISSAAILKANVYSLALFIGFPALLIGLAWVMCMVVLAAIATFRDGRAELISRR
jgi:hypothetical protein